MSVNFKVNGKSVTSNVEGDTPLLWVIRRSLVRAQVEEPNRKALNFSMFFSDSNTPINLTHCNLVI